MGTLVTGVCRWYSRVVERVRLHEEPKVSYKEDKAEPPRQSYVDRVGLGWLVYLLTIARFARLHRGRDCTRAQVTPT